jgi:hypothetical protein
VHSNFRGKHYYLRLPLRSINRRHVVVHKTLAEAEDGGYMSGSDAERLSVVWDLTRDAWLFFRKEDAERRLQRHVGVLARREG